MKDHLAKNLLALGLSLSMTSIAIIPVLADSNEDSKGESLPFEKTSDSGVGRALLQGKVNSEKAADKINLNDTVRVSIVLDKDSTLSAGYAVEDIAHNEKAMSYRASLKAEQDKLASRISSKIGEELDVVWNMTLAANMISANVTYGQIDEIKAVADVSDVIIENRYEPQTTTQTEELDPNMATSSEQIGSNAAYMEGYTGAGSRVAIIDTGTDTDHKSFQPEGYEKGLEVEAEKRGMTLEAFKESLNLLTREEVEEIAPQLNIARYASGKEANLYLNSKLPFAFNYVDNDFDVTHDNDTEGEHGSHVAGIATANSYVVEPDGSITKALDTVHTQGVAPETQLITMKVFGKGGGAYDSDYMIAIEDALVLGCDSVNLSLGSSAAGFSRESNEAYNAILNQIKESGTVVSMSAGNSGYWAENAFNDTGYLYGDDVSFHTGGSPGTFVNSLGVASADNIGMTGLFFSVGSTNALYMETQGYRNTPLTTLAGDNEFIFTTGKGTPEELNAIGADLIKDKIVFISRGDISFSEKANNAGRLGARGVIIYNNTGGTISMDLSDLTYAIPVVSILQSDALNIQAASTPQTTSDGTTYYTGTMNIGESVGNMHNDSFPMSDFSSWGVPGSLIMKPEITAPGGNIYSVNGAVAGGQAYENMSGTSMASPQIAGMAAVMGQYIRENNLVEKTGMSARQLTNSLLMSTAVPVDDVTNENGGLYSILSQGAGLANVGKAVAAKSYITVEKTLSNSEDDGKVKFELGDDAERTGDYTMNFTLHNMTDEALNYTLSAEFFTQDLFDYNGETYLDTWTTGLDADVTFTVNGETYVPEANSYSADINKDGKTTAEDARAILKSVTGAEKLDADQQAAADIDGDGKVTTKDAHELLSNLAVSGVKVGANENLDIEVSVKLTADQKKSLDALYENGAYVEGFIYASTGADREGNEGTKHSIPVLGFYGNYADASMFDRADYISALYGENKTPYTGALQTNVPTLKYPGDTTTYIFTGNPYLIENEIPTDKYAINSNTTLAAYRLSLIRNADSVASYAKDENGKVIYLGPIQSQIDGAYYNDKQSTWASNSASLNIGKKVSEFGVKEGDKITVGVAAVTEYYGNANGDMDPDDLTQLLEEGTIRKGSVLETTFTVDNTAPELLAVQKDLLTGNLIVSAKDNQHMAMVAVTNKSGSEVYTQGVPNTTEPGQTVTFRTDITNETGGEYVRVVLSDYAGNETDYLVYYGGEPEDYTGRMFGFTSSNVNGSGLRWVEIDPANLNYSSSNATGLTSFGSSSLDVYAAEYVDKHVVFATDNAFYIAAQDEIEEVTRMSHFSSEVAGVADMAFNYMDQKMYFLTTDNQLFTLDLTTGKQNKVADITITNPNTTSSANLVLRTLAIDDAGNFYAANNGSGRIPALYTWTLADVAEGALNLAPATENSLATSGLYLTSTASMAWDHDRDILYLTGSYGTKSSSDVDNELWTVDVTTGLASQKEGQNNQFRAHVVGLYVVPNASSILPGDVDPTGVELSATSADLLKGETMTLEADVTPWSTSKKAVTWSSSDESVAVVDENGNVTAKANGTATITAASAVNPELTASCEISVTSLANVKFSALAGGNWVEGETDNPEASASHHDGANYIAGTLHEGMIYTHDGSTMWGIDPDTFEVTSFGGIVSSWIWSDAAASPKVDGMFGKLVALCNHGTYLEMITPEEGSLSYWNLSSYFTEDPMAVIAYAGQGDYEYSSWTQSGVYPAEFYYMMTESGHLYKFNIFTDSNGADYSMVREDLGDTGLDLTGVSAVTAGQQASMIYDEEEGYLVLSRYMEGDETELFGIVPESLKVARLGTFGEGVHPAGVLYQYDRATDLTIKCNTESLNLYTGDTAAVDAKVVLGNTGELTWATSDPAVATVENGVITAVGAGTATITITTVDTNAAGEHVTKEIPVSVKDLVKLNASTSMQKGTQWVTTDLTTGQDTVLKDNATALTGGGLGNDALYGDDVDLSGSANGTFYRISTEDFTETAGSGVSTSYAMLDGAPVPALTATLTQEGQDPVTATLDASLIYLANSQGLYLLTDFVNGKITGWESLNMGDVAAISYLFSQEVDEPVLEQDGEEIYGCDAGTLEHYYAILGTDGTLNLARLTPVVDIMDGETTAAVLIGTGVLGSIDRTFADTNGISMDYVMSEDGESEGFVITDTHSNALLYADLTQQITDSHYAAGKIANLNTNAAALFNTAFHATEAGETVQKRVLRAFAPEKADGTASLKKEAASAEAKAAAARMSDRLETHSAAKPTANPVAGGTQAVAANRTSVKKIDTADKDDGDNVVIDRVNKTVTIKLNATDSTNGLVDVTWNRKDLTLVSVAGTDVSSYDATSSKVTYAYAEEEAINGTVAVLTFSYDTEKLNTSVNVKVREDGDDVSGEVSTRKINLKAAAVYSVTTSVENGSAQAPATVEAGNSVTVTLTPEDGYRLPSSVNVKIAGKPLSRLSYKYSALTGTVVIPSSSVKGDVEVIAKCVEAAPTYHKVDVSINHGKSNAPTRVAVNKDLSFQIKANFLYKLPESITVKVAGRTLDASEYSYNAENGRVTIDKGVITGDVEISADCSFIVG